MAGDVGGGVEGEEEEGAIKVAGLAGAAKGDALAEVFDPLFVIVEDGVLRGFEPAGKFKKSAQ